MNLLYRRYRIFEEPSPESIKRGYARHGKPFMTKVIGTLSGNPSISNFSLSDGIPGLTGEDPALIGPLPDPNQPAATTTSGGKVWGFLDKLFGTVSNAGNAIGGFKASLAGDPTGNATTVNYPVTGSSNKTLYIIGGILVVVLIAIIIWKRKS